jgi:transcriptional regulator with GAF, ATPase, and Fis domain
MPLDDQRLIDTLIDFADTLVSDFDVSDLFYRLVDAAVELADADEAGLLLKNQHGNLQIAASTGGSAHLVELLQLQAEEGPCLDAFRSGERVSTGPLDAEEARDRWPRFAPMASDAGFSQVLAMPMRLRDDVIGSLNLFRSDEVGESDPATAKALADLTTIAILQDRAASDSKQVIGQLQTALDSRVVIEQAKGMVSERTGIDLGASFDRMRSYSRSHNLRLRDLSDRIVAGEIIQDLLGDSDEEA